MDNLQFNSKILSELLSNEFLMIYDDNEARTLIIKLQCNPKLLSGEQKRELKKFFIAIQNELSVFKKERDIVADCQISEADQRTSLRSLRINIPTQALYDVFIQRLVCDHLVPVKCIKQNINDEFFDKIDLFRPEPGSFLNEGMNDECDAYQELPRFSRL